MRTLARDGATERVAEPLKRLEAGAVEVGASWSGSPLGYHSLVYFKGFREPPPGAHWSSEWGSVEAFSNPSRGEWAEYTFSAVTHAVHERAHNPSLAEVESASSDARTTVRDAQSEVRSILTAFLGERSDHVVESLLEESNKLIIGTSQEYERAFLPSGSIMSRDSLAMSQGLRVAPHISIQAQVLALRAPFQTADQLGDIASRAATHMRRLGGARRATAQTQGSAVFIGHGHSLLWLELKDFLQDRLGLAWEEFNRVPVAGVTNIARLAEMLDAAGIAFLVLTAEDEQTTGEVVARQNVVHEAGLFQGRLGFTRAILLLEDGCAEFSNIQGLGQIRFPRRRISAAFEEVRRVLEREGFV